MDVQVKAADRVCIQGEQIIRAIIGKKTDIFLSGPLLVKYEGLFAGWLA
jgi:hypothetical protein